MQLDVLQRVKTRPKTNESWNNGITEDIRRQVCVCVCTCAALVLVNVPGNVGGGGANCCYSGRRLRENFQVALGFSHRFVPFLFTQFI